MGKKSSPSRCECEGEDRLRPEYCVVLSEVDNTFNTVPVSDILFSGIGEPDIGDQVCFYWNKEKHTGPIHHMGDDFNACNKLAKTLTGQVKNALVRQQSFHAERPRNSKLKGMQNMTKRSGAHSNEPPLKRKKTSSKAQKADRKQRRELEEGIGLLGMDGLEHQLGSDSDITVELENTSDKSENTSASSVSSDAQSPNSKPTSSSKSAQRLLEEKIKLLSEQLAESVARINGINHHSQVTETPKSKRSDLNGVTKSLEINGFKKLESPKRQAKPSASSTPNKTYHALYLAKGNPFLGQMLIHDGATNDTKELLGPDNRKSGIYCDRYVFESAESSGSATSAARRLLEGIFTSEAILSCSITGLPPRGKGKQAYADTTVIKSHLCPKAVRAIIDQALEWQKTKYLRPKKDASSIRTAMSIKLCGLRKGLSNSKEDSYVADT